MDQLGGACSLCGAEGVNIKSCPLAGAKKSNKKHNSIALPPKVKKSIKTIKVPELSSMRPTIPNTGFAVSVVDRFIIRIPKEKCIQIELYLNKLPKTSERINLGNSLHDYSITESQRSLYAIDMDLYEEIKKFL